MPISFYRDVLGLRLISQHKPAFNTTLAYLGLNNEDGTTLELVEINGWSPSSDQGNQHIAFLVDNIIDEYARLQRVNIEFLDLNIMEHSDGMKHIFFTGINEEVIELIERN